MPELVNLPDTPWRNFLFCSFVPRIPRLNDNIAMSVVLLLPIGARDFRNTVLKSCRQAAARDARTDNILLKYTEIAYVQKTEKLHA